MILIYLKTINTGTEYSIIMDNSAGALITETGACELSKDKLESAETNITGSVSETSHNTSKTDVSVSANVASDDTPDSNMSVSTGDKPETPETESSTQTSGQPSSEDIQRVLKALLKTNDASAEELEAMGISSMAIEVRDIRKNLIELLESIHSTAMELEGRDFHAMAKIIKSNQKKGLFPSLLVSEIMKSIMGEYEKDICLDEYHDTLEILKKFDSNVIEYKEVNELFYPKAPKMMAFLNEQYLLKEEVFLEYMKINKENDNIRGKIAGFKKIDMSGIVEFMTALQDNGILTEVLLSNYKTLANRVDKANVAIDQHSSRMKNMITRLCYIGIDYPNKILPTMVIHEENLNYFKNCGKNISPENFEEEVRSKITNPDSKPKTCRLNHNLPYCVNCGYQNSWVKAFKRRGVYVKTSKNDQDGKTWRVYKKVYLD